MSPWGPQWNNESCWRLCAPTIKSSGYPPCQASRRGLSRGEMRVIFHAPTVYETRRRKR